MADTQDNRPGEDEEEEEEEIDEAVSLATYARPCVQVSSCPGIQDDEGRRALRHPCQSDYA